MLQLEKKKMTVGKEKKKVKLKLHSSLQHPGSILAYLGLWLPYDPYPQQVLGFGSETSQRLQCWDWVPSAAVPQVDHKGSNCISRLIYRWLYNLLVSWEIMKLSRQGLGIQRATVYDLGTLYPGCQMVPSTMVLLPLLRPEHQEASDHGLEPLKL